VKEESVEMEVCTNYRYSNRHDAAFASKRALLKKDEEKAAVEPSIRETPRASVNNNQRVQKQPKGRGAKSSQLLDKSHEKSGELD